MMVDYGLGGGRAGWRLWGDSQGVVPFIPSVSGTLTLASFPPLRSSVSDPYVRQFLALLRYRGRLPV